jgi:serine/threonine-protein kinase/endoribonuclease IRE1
MPNALRFTTLLLLAFAAAQQQHQPQNGNGNGNVNNQAQGKGHRSSPQENAALRPNTLSKSGDLPLRVDTSTFKRGKYTSPIQDNKRAVATLAPADLNPAVHTPSARSAAGPSGGLATPPRARSLQDWEVENFVLLATVDGSIYARDRNSGKELWKFHSERPMVETVYHRHNDSGRREKGDYMWIVEPNEDGSLYVFIPGPDAGIQKLGMTVKQLAEVLSPYASEDSPFVFTAEKRNTLFTLNATNGAALKYFSAGGSGVMDQKSCRRINNLEIEDDEDECEPTPTLHLGRTEYTVGIQDKNTMETVCTIRYFEWTPNNRDRDLANKYLNTMDNKYIYSRYDGSVIALEHVAGDREQPVPLFQKKATSPVVRVFDVVRPQGTDARDTPLVVLPQPIAPVMRGERGENVFVNCTESGSWYAMSETSYPSVTDGAAEAKCYQPKGSIPDSSFWEDDQQYFKPSELVGVHALSDEWREEPLELPTIGPATEPPPEEQHPMLPDNATDHQTSNPPSKTSFSSLWAWLGANNFQLTLIVLGLCFMIYQRKHGSTLQNSPPLVRIGQPALAPITETIPDAPIEQSIVPPADAPERRVRFAPIEDEKAETENILVDQSKYSFQHGGGVLPFTAVLPGHASWIVSIMDSDYMLEACSMT